MAFLQRGTMPETQNNSPSQSTTPTESPSSAFSKRSLRQLGLFFGGAAFFGFASVITRRALVRRYQSIVPKFYQQSNRPNAQVDGALEAFEALSIATVNVLSVSMMFSGGMLWAFDISSLDDMRRKIRGGLGIDGSEGRESAAEEEMEEWLATVLARKDDKEKRKKASKDNDKS
jgi:hypothetical protein